VVNKDKVKVFVRKQRVTMAFWLAVTLACQAATWRIMCGYYLTVGSQWVLLTSAVLAIVIVSAVMKLAYWMLREMAAESQDKWQRSYSEVVRIARSLCRRRGIPLPIIGLWKGTFFEGTPKTALAQSPREKIVGKLLSINAGLADVPFGRDIMLVGEKLPEILTEAELEAVLAHELRHSDQPENKAALVPAIGQAAIALLFTIGSVDYLCTAGLWLEQTWLVLFAGMTLVRLNRGVVTVTMAAFSRAREFETDAEASQDIPSEEALISALEKLSAAMEEACSGLEPKPPHRRSHPAVKARAASLRALV